MDKAQAVHLDACLPQSYWEFAVQFAIHVYNRTPLHRTSWRTPYETLTGNKPDVTHLRVFRCSTYVFLPEEVHVNKLSPKSELMTFIRYPDGTKGFLFMRKPNNVVFTAVQALFDEMLFLNCPNMHHPGHTVVREVPPQLELHIPPGDEGTNNHGNNNGSLWDPNLRPSSSNGRASFPPHNLPPPDNNSGGDQGSGGDKHSESIHEPPSPRTPPNQGPAPVPRTPAHAKECIYAEQNRDPRLVWYTPGRNVANSFEELQNENPDLDITVGRIDDLLPQCPRHMIRHV